MPNRDGTGPMGRGPRSGGGTGNCGAGRRAGFGRGRGSRSRGFGRTEVAATAPLEADPAQVDLLRKQTEDLARLLRRLETRIDGLHPTDDRCAQDER